MFLTHIKTKVLWQKEEEKRHNKSLSRLVGSGGCEYDGEKGNLSSPRDFRPFHSGNKHKQNQKQAKRWKENEMSRTQMFTTETGEKVAVNLKKVRFYRRLNIFSLNESLLSAKNWALLFPLFFLNRVFSGLEGTDDGVNLRGRYKNFIRLFSNFK